MLSDALAHSMRERFSSDSLDQLCNTLEEHLKSHSGLHVELYEAMVNYVYQLRDGAIQTSEDTNSLFREAIALLREEEAPVQGKSLDDRTVQLLERFDLEASGGFDASEAGEVPDVQSLSVPNSESLQTQNTLHRLFASLAMIERHSGVEHSSASLETAFSRHRRLLGALVPIPQPSHSVSLASLEETLSLRPTQADAVTKLVADGTVHPSYIPNLASLLAELASTLSAFAPNEMKISREHTELQLQFSLSVNQSILSGLRTSAINRGFLHADAPLRDGSETHYLLLSESTQASDHLIHQSVLLDVFQSYCATVAIETSEESTQLLVTLPADARSEQVTVFKLAGSLYAVPTDAITDIDYEVTQSDVSFESFLKTDQGSFRVASIYKSSSEQEACLLIDEGGVRVALWVDQIEPPGQLIVLDRFTPQTHFGGGVRLHDRRLVVLLSAADLEGISKSTPKPQPSTSPRLLVLGHVPLAQSLSEDFSQFSYATDRMNAIAAFQERRPHAILTTQSEITTYAHLITTAKRLDVPVIVQRSANHDEIDEELAAEFITIATLTDLATAVQNLTVQSGKPVP